MIITSEILDRYITNEGQVEEFNRLFPHGIDSRTLVSNPDIPIEWAHWGMMYLPLTDGEKMAYLTRCNIDIDSKGVSYSSDVVASTGIGKSKNIVKCEWVRNSDHITESRDIYSCTDVRGSTDCVESCNVKDSNYVFYSSNVSDSTQIYASNNIDWGDCVMYSDDTEGCGYIYHTKNARYSYFCGFSTNIDHCMFCTDVSDAKNLIFNKPVSPAELEHAQITMTMLLSQNPLNNRVVFADKSYHLPEKRYVPMRRIDEMFWQLNSDFYEWVRTLPNYDENVLIQVLLTDKGLKI